MIRMKSGHLILCILLSASCGCSNWNKTQNGAAIGGVTGAGLGAIVGSQVGAAGPGVAIGGAAGAVTGGLIGNQLDQIDEHLSYQAEKQRRTDRVLKAQRREIEELKRQRLEDSRARYGE